jgi:hypothetical protein
MLFQVRGVPGVLPPNAVLIFQLGLLGVQPPPPPVPVPGGAPRATRASRGIGPAQSLTRDTRERSRSRRLRYAGGE